MSSSKKLKRLKLANSIRMHVTEELYLDARKYSISMDGPIIRVQDLEAKHPPVFTSLYNVIWFDLEEETTPSESPEVKSGSKRTSKTPSP